MNHWNMYIYKCVTMNYNLMNVTNIDQYYRATACRKICRNFSIFFFIYKMMYANSNWRDNNGDFNRNYFLEMFNEQIFLHLIDFITISRNY